MMQVDFSDHRRHAPRLHDLVKLFEHALETPGYGQSELSAEEAEVTIRKAKAELSSLLKQALSSTSQGSGQNLADANQKALSKDQEIAGLREEVRRKDEALRYYADTFCEIGPFHECCGKLTDDDCSGCRARTALSQNIGKNEGEA